MILLYIVLGFVALVAAYIVVRNNRAPELGVAGGRLTPLPATPNAVSTQTDDLARRIEPLPFAGDLSASKERVLEAVNAYGHGVVVANEPNYLRIVFTTPGMRFKDDAEFSFDEQTRTIHYRSSSRVGASDMGLNRRRYEELRARYVGDSDDA